MSGAFRCGAMLAVLWSVLITSASASAPTGEFDIDLVVIGADPNVGKIVASLFDSSESYMREPLAEAGVRVDPNGAAVVDFGSHPPGLYAIVVYYDKNENGKLDTGMFRIPKEKIGFSNDAKGRFGPAKWADAQFSLESSHVQIEIHLTRAAAD